MGYFKVLYSVEFEEFEECVYVEAPGESDIRGVDLLELLDNPSSQQFDRPEITSLRTEGIEPIKKPKGGVDAYVFEKRIVDQSTYKELVNYRKEKEKNKPLPGQLGIPGIKEDIPKEE